MAPGYVDTLSDVLSSDFDLKLTNASVGGNTSVFGLLSLKLGDEVEANDVIVVEFAINDYSLCRPETWPFYCSSVEGMVRDILHRNRFAQVFLILLGRRAQEAAETSQKMFEFSLELSKNYGVHTVGVDSHLKKTLSAEEFRNAYSDDLHYKRHIATDVVGPYVANCIASVWHAPLAPRWDSPAVSADTFEPAVAISARDLLDRPVVTFENSRFAEHTLEIKAGETVKVAVPGRILLARFVSCSNSCQVKITESHGKKHTFDSARPEMDGDRFSFLIRSAPFSRRDWAKVPKGIMNEVTIEVLPPEGPASPNPAMETKAIVNKSDEPAFYLSSFLVY